MVVLCKSDLPTVKVTGMYKLTVRYANGNETVTYPANFDDMSEAVDAALSDPGFVGYVVGPVR